MNKPNTKSRSQEADMSADLKSQIAAAKLVLNTAPLTAAQVERAASAALAAGAITGAEAAHIATHLSIHGKCPEPLLKKLRGEA